MTPGEGQPLQAGDEPPGGRPEPSLVTPSQRVLVAGAGAIGQWLGLKLLQTGQDVTLLARPRHVAAIRQGGLRVTGLSEAHAHIKAVDRLEDTAGAFDLVALTCKAHQTAELAAAVAPRLAPAGTLLSLQNGLGNSEKIRAAVPAGRIAIGLTSHGVTIQSPGRLLHAGTGPTLVGPFPGAPDFAARTAFRVLGQAGLAPEWQAPMRGYVWRKAIVNAGINPVGALEGATNGGILRRTASLDQCLALVGEAEAVARAAGVDLPPGDLREATRATLQRTADNKCSMLQDIEAQRPTEVEQITGRLARLGARLGLALPRTRDVYARVKALEGSYLGAEAAAAFATAEMRWEREPV